MITPCITKDDKKAVSGLATKANFFIPLVNGYLLTNDSLPFTKHIITYKKDGKVIGFACWTYPNESHEEYESSRYNMLAELILVDKKYRGQGIGKALVDSILQWSEETSRVNIKIQFERTDKKLKKWYSKMGFSEQNREPNDNRHPVFCDWYRVGRPGITANVSGQERIEPEPVKQFKRGQTLQLIKNGAQASKNGFKIEFKNPIFHDSSARAECDICGISTAGRKVRGLWNNALCEECGANSDEE
jgi:GNAT superfamily N-acetyltransferase